MSTKRKASDLPWCYGEGISGSENHRGFFLFSGDSKRWSLGLIQPGDPDGDLGRANADLIVRAVNSHAQLVAAIERFVAAADDSCDASTDHDDVRAMLEYAEAFDQLRAALAAAKGAA